jgi:hypothetical protein
MDTRVTAISLSLELPLGLALSMALVERIHDGKEKSSTVSYSYNPMQIYCLDL